MDDLGIKCPNSHWMCKLHSLEFLDQIFKAPDENSIPIKCFACKVKVLSTSVEPFLTDDQMFIFEYYRLLSEGSD